MRKKEIERRLGICTGIYGLSSDGAGGGDGVSEYRRPSHLGIISILKLLILMTAPLADGEHGELLFTTLTKHCRSFVTARVI
ncbi:hypothetical protein MOP93_09285 [Escherichia coli]|nr:hypothetical protein [Escherichia coli]